MGPLLVGSRSAIDRPGGTWATVGEPAGPLSPVLVEADVAGGNFFFPGSGSFRLWADGNGGHTAQLSNDSTSNANALLDGGLSSNILDGIGALGNVRRLNV